jgi:hypothetical protein
MTDPKLVCIIPAYLGFEVLYLYKPGSEPAFGREPIIAWRVEDDHQPTPIAITPSRSTEHVGIGHPLPGWTGPCYEFRRW